MLRNNEVRLHLPDQDYVALYGSISGDWRDGVVRSLSAVGIAWYDPADAGWQGISASNGDARQAEIDALVQHTQRGLERAACVLFHLARREVMRGQDTGKTTIALAARLELGFIAGRGIRAFVHIEPDVEGRNYLWAYVATYAETMRRCDSLADATAHAIGYMTGR